MNRMKRILVDIAKGLAEDFLWLIILTLLGGDAVITSLVLFIISKVTQDIELPLWQLGVMIAFFILLFPVLIIFISNHSVNMIRKRIIYIKLKKYINNHNYVKSIQLYNLVKTIDDIQCNYEIIRFGGVTDDAFETNCILEDRFQIPLDFYYCCKEIFDMMKNDQKMLLKKNNEPCSFGRTCYSNCS